MARQRMVTRTVTGTQVNVLCLDTESCEPFNKDLMLSSTFKDHKKLMKAVQSVIDTDTVKAVKIVSKEEVNKCYGMSEQDFIEKAQELNPETRKALEQEKETEEEA